MKKSPYIPDRGDVVWLNFSPHSGHEQAGRRPALVISSIAFNRSGLFIVCPVTSKRKGSPFEVNVLIDGVKGSVLTAHAKSLDWRSRKIKPIGKLSADTVHTVQKFVVSIVLN